MTGYVAFLADGWYAPGMSGHQEQSGFYCPNCRQQRMFVRTVTGPNHVLHLLLTILLCGVWASVWLIVTLVGGSKSPWCCTTCGSYPLVPSTPAAPLPQPPAENPFGPELPPAVKRIPNFPGDP